MKFIHISDLHLGKRLNEYSLIEDQKYILNQILGIIDAEKPEALLISGDVYDKSVPSTEALELFDGFLYELSKRKLEVFTVSGNHDSCERLSFGARLMLGSGIHICKAYGGEAVPYVLKDEWGEVNVYMLPFLRPSSVKGYFNEDMLSYTDALGAVIGKMNLDTEKRNLLVAHQFVTGASQSGSEDISVGGLDNVDASVFLDFDYVALGHIHRQQNIGNNIRYCGTPLKYSLSEVNDEKSVTVLELCEKGKLSIRTVKLTPLREMNSLRGKYNDLMHKSFYENTTLTEDYVHFTLTDDEEIVDAKQKLGTVYKNILSLSYDNKRTEYNNRIDSSSTEQKTPFELFSELYELQNNTVISEGQAKYVKELIDEVWEADK